MPWAKGGRRRPPDSLQADLTAALQLQYAWRRATRLRVAAEKEERYRCYIELMRSAGLVAASSPARRWGHSAEPPAADDADSPATEADELIGVLERLLAGLDSLQIPGRVSADVVARFIRLVLVAMRRVLDSARAAQERADFDELISRLRFEEFEEACRVKEAEERENAARRRDEQRREYEAAVAAREAREAQALEEKKQFQRDLAAKLAEDDRVEQLSAQKRRMKLLEHQRGASFGGRKIRRARSSARARAPRTRRLSTRARSHGCGHRTRARKAARRISQQNRQSRVI